MKTVDFQEKLQTIVCSNLYESDETVIGKVKEYLNSCVDDKLLVDYVLNYYEKDNTLTVVVALRLASDEEYTTFTIIAGP